MYAYAYRVSFFNTSMEALNLDTMETLRQMSLATAISFSGKFNEMSDELDVKISEIVGTVENHTDPESMIARLHEPL